MHVQLRLDTQAPVADAEDPLVLLQECHARIRHFSQLALVLARAQGKPEAQVADAARQVARYFRVSLPLHAADEDEGLAPRLRAVGVPATVEQALAEMERQHVELETLLAEVMPGWERVAEDPRALVVHAGTLERQAVRLAALFEAHLHLEETVLFPAARLMLGPGQRKSLAREMRARRA